MNENNTRTSYFLITILSMVCGFSLILVLLHSPEIREPLPEQENSQDLVDEPSEASEKDSEEKQEVEEEKEEFSKPQAAKKSSENNDEKSEKKERSKDKAEPKDPLGEKAFDKLRNKIDDIADE